MIGSLFELFSALIFRWVAPVDFRGQKGEEILLRITHLIRLISRPNKYPRIAEMGKCQGVTSIKIEARPRFDDFSQTNRNFSSDQPLAVAKAHDVARVPEQRRDCRTVVPFLEMRLDHITPSYLKSRIDKISGGKARLPQFTERRTGRRCRRWLATCVVQWRLTVLDILNSPVEETCVNSN